MKAQVIEKFGGPEVFEEREIDRPGVRAGHVLIRVEATSVNPVDYKIRVGSVPAGPEFPAVLHGDVAGVVEEVGEGVSGFSAGDEVYGCAGGFAGMDGGASAEYLLADADLLARKPESLSMREAAALPLVSITAWEVLIGRADVRPGQNVLVHGAAGGVGHVAIQLARAAGATVFATGSSDEKLRVARDLGADVGINYREQDFVEVIRGEGGADVILDVMGAKYLERNVDALGLDGRLVIIGMQGGTKAELNIGKLLSKRASVAATNLRGRPLENKARIVADVRERLWPLVEQGSVVPIVDQVVPMSDAATAHRAIEGGGVFGKVLLAAR